MKVQKRRYTNGTVYRFKTDLLSEGLKGSEQALNIVARPNDRETVMIYQRFWTEEPHINERVLRQSKDMFYIERAVHLKLNTLQIINEIIENP